jgi:hypothetical protein
MHPQGLARSRSEQIPMGPRGYVVKTVEMLQGNLREES